MDTDRRKICEKSHFHDQHIAHCCEIFILLELLHILFNYEQRFPHILLTCFAIDQQIIKWKCANNDTYKWIYTEEEIVIWVGVVFNFFLVRNF